MGAKNEVRFFFNPTAIDLGLIFQLGKAGSIGSAKVNAISCL